MDIEKRVREFHVAMDIPVYDKPWVPTEDREHLRVELILEELEEYVQAVVRRNLADIADALGDLVYVCFGAALEYGIPLNDVIDEIHKANMRKQGGPVRADGKQLKPEGWVGPDINRILDDAQS